MCYPDTFLLSSWHDVFSFCEQAVPMASKSLCASAGVLQGAVNTSILSRALEETWSHEGNMMYFHPAHSIKTLLSFMFESSPVNMQETFIYGIFHQKWRSEVLIMLVSMAKIAMGMWGNCLSFKLYGGQVHFWVPVSSPEILCQKCHKHL